MNTDLIKKWEGCILKAYVDPRKHSGKASKVARGGKKSYLGYIFAYKN